MKITRTDAEQWLNTIITGPTKTEISIAHRAAEWGANQAPQPEQSEPTHYVGDLGELYTAERAKFLGLHTDVMLPLYTRPAPLREPEQEQPYQFEPPNFPTALRKMWSGSEVQQWINENWHNAPPLREMSYEELLGAIARGWCTPVNEKKVMDSDLAIAIAEEIVKYLATARSKTP